MQNVCVRGLFLTLRTTPCPLGGLSTVPSQQRILFITLQGADQSCSLHWTEDGDAPLKEVEAGSVSR